MHTGWKWLNEHQCGPARRWRIAPDGTGHGVLPMIGDRAEALVAIYPKGAGIDLIAALSGPDFSLQSVTKKLIVLGRLRIVSVSKKDQKLFQNLNERSDVHKMLNKKVHRPVRWATLN